MTDEPKRRHYAPQDAIDDQRLAAMPFRVFWRLLVFADRTGHYDQSVGTIAKGLGLARSTAQSHINAPIRRLVCVRKFSQTHSDGAHAANRCWAARPSSNIGAARDR
jgi:hypothetical protein